MIKRRFFGFLMHPTLFSFVLTLFSSKKDNSELIFLNNEDFDSLGRHSNVRFIFPAKTKGYRVQNPLITQTHP